MIKISNDLEKIKKKKKALITTVCPVSEKSSEYLLM